MEAKIENITVNAIILLWSFIGIIIGLYMLGVFTGYITSLEPIVVGGYVIIASVAVLLETFYESPGIKGLKDLTPRNMVSLLVGVLGLITGFALFGSVSIPTQLVPIAAIIVLAVSVFMAIETRE